MRKAELLSENERLRFRIRELINVLCPAEQHDFNEVRMWFEPDDYDSPAACMLTCRELICKRCFTRKVVKKL